MTQAFDPAAATAAYLATLPPEAHAKAVAYTQGGHWLLLWGAVVSIASAWIILRTDLVDRAVRAVQAARPRPRLAVLAAVGVFIVFDFLISLPWAVYASWWRERHYGLSSQPFGSWFGEALISLAINVVGVALLMLGIYAVVRRAPKTWWLWSSAVVAGFMALVFLIGPVFIEPLFNTYKPAPPGPVRNTVAAMARANGVPSDKIFIYDGSKQSNRYSANVSGLFGTARIAMSDVMFKKNADIAEVKGVVGHEMGHYVLNHPLRFSAITALLALIGFLIADRLFPVVARLAGARGVEGIGDPAGYPVIAMLFTVIGLLATPAFNTMVRTAEAEADRFSLERVNEPDGLSRALVKTIEYRAATPSALEEAIFYDHPSVGRRIRTAMDWKAAHPAAP